MKQNVKRINSHLSSRSTRTKTDWNFQIVLFFGKCLISGVFYDKMYIMLDENKGELS